MSNRRTPIEMLGEFMREAAVLIGVFLPLDAHVNRALTGSTFGLTVVIAAPMLAIGIWLEVSRHE